MKATIVTMFCLLVSSAVHGAEPSDSVVTRGHEPLGSSPLANGLLLSRYMSSHHLDPTSSGLLTISLNPFANSVYVPATRFEAMLFGAGSAGTLAMFVGAIGNTLGAFDEDTTWILTGAAAAVGAIYSGSRYQVRATLHPDPWSIPSGPPRSP
jgi:hypothetical protein